MDGCVIVSCVLRMREEQRKDKMFASVQAVAM
jgi:hypothetical protein